MNEQDNKIDEIKGFPLFFDIEDQELRNRNQAVILCNMFEDGSKDGKVQPKTMLSMIQYFRQIPEAERQIVYTKFSEGMRARGFGGLQ